MIWLPAECGTYLSLNIYKWNCDWWKWKVNNHAILTLCSSCCLSICSSIQTSKNFLLFSMILSKICVLYQFADEHECLFWSALSLLLVSFYRKEGYVSNKKQTNYDGWIINSLSDMSLAHSGEIMNNKKIQNEGGRRSFIF